MPQDTGNFWQDYVLPYEPELAYYSAAPFGTRATAASPFGQATYDPSGQVTGAVGGFSPAAQNYWSGQYGNVMREFMGEAGRAMKRGTDPTDLSFEDFLEQYPWTQRYSALGPRLRPGGGTARFNPAARYMY